METSAAARGASTEDIATAEPRTRGAPVE